MSTSPGNQGQWQRVARASDLADGDIRPVSAFGRELIVCRIGADYFAAQRRCLHQGADLADGVIAGDDIVCPLHGWRYRAATGVHVQSSQNCLVVHRVRVIDGWVEVHSRQIRNAQEPW